MKFHTQILRNSNANFKTVKSNENTLVFHLSPDWSEKKADDFC